ncbi:MAG: hypothetical protein R3C68_16805 [Myxococcota bacterium]
MAFTEDICKSVVDAVEDGLACAVVDLDTGMLFGVHNKVEYLSQSCVDALAAAAVEMFRGRRVQGIEEMIGKARGASISNVFTEIMAQSESIRHYMKVIPEKAALAVLVTRTSSDHEVGWSALRNAVGEIGQSLS